MVRSHVVVGMCLCKRPCDVDIHGAQLKGEAQHLLGTLENFVWLEGVDVVMHVGGTFIFPHHLRQEVDLIAQVFSLPHLFHCLHLHSKLVKKLLAAEKACGCGSISATMSTISVTVFHTFKIFPKQKQLIQHVCIK